MQKLLYFFFMNRAVLILCSFLQLLILVPCAQSAAARQWPGINSGLETEQISDKVRDLNVKWVRLTIYWYKVEPSNGRFNWDEPDVQIQRAAARNLSLYITVHGTPKWANGGRGINHPPRKSSDWANFVSVLSQRYRNQPAVKAYGMWNEPNLRKFWTGTRNEYIKKILKPGYTAIKRQKRTLLVGAPDITHHWPVNQDWQLDEFMNEARKHLDVLTVHYYTDAPYSFELYLDRLVKPYRLGKKVWITEIGHGACSSRRCSEDQQSRQYLNFFKAQRSRTRWFKKIFPYRVWDPLEFCNKNGSSMGITYGVDLRERPAYRTYRDFILRRPYRDPDAGCK